MFLRRYIGIMEKKTSMMGLYRDYRVNMGFILG